MADYNKTLNLPQTEFPMRAGLPTREPDFVKKWTEEGLYQTLVEQNNPLRAPSSKSRSWTSKR